METNSRTDSPAPHGKYMPLEVANTSMEFEPRVVNLVIYCSCMTTVPLFEPTRDLRRQLPLFLHLVSEIALCRVFFAVLPVLYRLSRL